jgi:hypothetical protein
MLLQPRTRILARGTRRPVSLPVAIIAGSLLLGFVSLLLPTAPTYDPFAWIIWGREIAHLDLNTVDGPSWKPLPVILTTITAPLGEASPYIWVAVARAGAIAAIALAGVLAWRLGGRTAGIVAAVALAAMPWWLRNNAMGNSEGIMVALVLGAALCHFEGRKGWAFTLAIGAGLLRPEAWPFLGLFALFLLWEDRSRLKWIAAGLASLPVLWLAPEYWGSGNAFRASDRAQNPRSNSPAFADHPALEVVKDAFELPPALAVGFAVVAFVLAGVVVARSSESLTGRLADRRSAIAVLVLTVLAAAWIALVAMMTVRGFSGNSRYLMVPAALLIVLGAVGVAWAVRALVPRLAPPAAVAAGVVLAALFVAPDAGQLGTNLRHVEYQADLYHDLGRLIDDTGGAAYLRDCGHVFTGPFLVPQVAWRLNLHGHQVDIHPRGESPAVIFHVRNTASGWVAPPYTRARPNLLGRRGHWALTADCEARR